VAAILEKEKVATIVKIKAFEHEEGSGDDKARLTVKIIATLKRTKK
jgi:hypothetical protein